MFLCFESNKECIVFSEKNTATITARVVYREWNKCTAALLFGSRYPRLNINLES